MPEITLSDAQLVAAARIDPAAFDAIYRRYATPVFRYLRARVASVADAEDLASQTFLEAMAGLGGYREQGRFPAWLFTIARRQVLLHRRRSGRPEQATFPQEAVADDRPEADDLAAVLAALARLDPERRDAIALRYFAGLKVAEVATVLGKGESATKMLIHRALKDVRNQVAGDADG